MIQYMPLGDARVHENWHYLRNQTEEEILATEVPLLHSADDIDIVVVGADRAKTLVFPSGPSSATVGIDQYK